VDVTCPACGAVLERLPDQEQSALELQCPSCGGPLKIRTGAGTKAIPAPGEPPRGGRRREDSAGTLFQPRTMVDADSGGFRSRPPSDGYLLLQNGGREERIPLEKAGTVFGADEVDVRLADPEVAPRHFRVDVQGNDFFLRDLDSGRGTLLNGREIRHVELRSGDEIRVGDLVLVFVTEPREMERGA